MVATRFAEAANQLLARAEPPADLSLPTLLRWIAQERGVLFHGSGRDDLTSLEPIRLTRDSMPFGDQQAVFAASDPVWAIYFATLRRENGFRSTRNGSLGVAGDALYPRWYYFTHNEGAGRADRFEEGFGHCLVEPRPAECLAAGGRVMQHMAAHARIASDAPARARIGDLHAPTAPPAAHQPLQQRRPLARRAAALAARSHVLTEPLARA